MPNNACVELIWEWYANLPAEEHAVIEIAAKKMCEEVKDKGHFLSIKGAVEAVAKTLLFEQERSHACE